MHYAVAIALVAASATAQWVVERPSAFVPPASARAGYDPVSGEAYLIEQAGLLRMWRFDDGVWTAMTQPGAQPPTIGPCCSVPGIGLLMHGNGTFVWNGTAWTNIPTAIAPGALHDLVWDPARNVAVGVTTTLETWEFNGTWQQRSSSWPTGGPAVDILRLAFLPNQQQVLALVSNAQAGFMHQWNGTSWTAGAPAPSRAGAAFTGFSFAGTPQQGVILSGGFQFPLVHVATAIWNGSVWNYLDGGFLITDGPELRNSSLSWFDSGRQRLVVTHGFGTAGPASANVNGFGVWYWNGVGYNWTRPARGNGPRFADAEAWDSWRGQLLQFGGTKAFGHAHNDLWARDRDGLWQRLSSGNGPPARHWHACAFDSRRGRLVVTGGSVTNTFLNNLEIGVDGDRTWEWDGAIWRAFATPSPQGPESRYNAAMAYDRARGRCVLFGGVRPPVGTLRNDTWEWDGAAWTSIQPATVPPAVDSPKLWFDPAQNACVLAANGLWRWSGSDWQLLTTPPPAGALSIAFDVARERVIATTATTPSAVLELQNGVWVQVATTLVPLAGFDVGRGRFAAVDAACWYDAGDASAGQMAPFGSGCAGSAGAPILHGESPLRLGVTRSVELANRPAGAPWFGLLGDEADVWLGLPLPFFLAPLGAPACALRTGITANELRLTDAWPIAVPNAPQLLGMALRLQALVLDAAANSFGATTSNGMRLRLGV